MDLIGKYNEGRRKMLNESSLEDREVFKGAFFLLISSGDLVLMGSVNSCFRKW